MTPEKIAEIQNVVAREFDYADAHEMFNDWFVSQNKPHNQPYRFIDRCIELASESKWISVVAPPEEPGNYVVWLKDWRGRPSEKMIVHYHKDTGWQYRYYDNRVMYWLPVEPPKTNN